MMARAKKTLDGRDIGWLAPPASHANDTRVGCWPKKRAHVFVACAAPFANNWDLLECRGGGLRGAHKMKCASGEVAARGSC